MKRAPAVLITAIFVTLISASDPPQSGGPAFRLLESDSPYLQQHADNAVSWYPWGDEAFERARAEDKPVYVSIGYSACHWCHVMEEESFMNAEVASLFDDSYIAVLVDREERPDLDSIYMVAANVLSGRGGWPLNVIMTPEGEPFYTFTYIPRESRPNQIGMLDLLPFFSDAWATRRPELLAAANEVTDLLARLQSVPAAADLPGQEEVERAVLHLTEAFDPEHGGFSEAPKFPQPHVLLFLLRYGVRTEDAALQSMVAQTLTEIRRGGIFDQVGFGVHRYSVDREWLTPHFEKMLYDQALLALAYTESWEALGDPLFRQSAEEILTYVNRDLSDRRGGFYASEDADSEGEEGTFYVWSHDELVRTLGARSELLLPLFGARPDGNFTDEATGIRRPENILHLTSGFADYAERAGLTERELREEWQSGIRALSRARSDRPRPFRDEKVLTDWNGLMIAAFARAGRAFDRPDFITRAQAGYDFVTSRLSLDGRLYHRYLDGAAGIPAFLDGYAAMLWAALELYESTFDTDYLASAAGYAEILVTDYLDADRGGFYLTADTADPGLVRQKISLDTDVPSGNSMVAQGLARLSRLTGSTTLTDHVWRTFESFSSLIERVPEGHSYMLSALDLVLNPSYEVVIVGRPNSRDTREMLELVRSVYRPGMVVLLKDPRDTGLAEVAEFTRYQGMLNGRATAYVCENFVCNLPTNDPAQMMALLSE